jgi:hypothetical protein
MGAKYAQAACLTVMNLLKVNSFLGDGTAGWKDIKGVEPDN